MDFEDDYYSLDALLAEQQKVPSTFIQNHAKVGFLLVGEDVPDIAAGAKTELPLWLARELAWRNYVTIERPKVYSERTRAHLHAGATVVNLYDLCPYFYLFGEKLFQILPEEVLLEILLHAFVERLELVVDHSRNSLNQDLSSVVRKMDTTERELFALGQQAASAFQQWKDRRSNVITSADATIVNGLKRRFPSN